MLYDNALLTSAYLEAHQVTNDPRYAIVARETLDYILDRMTSPEGGFYATEDADSEGVEGKFYVWSVDEVGSILGPERAKAFCYVYDVTKQGNWEEQSILNMPKPLEQAAKLLERDEGELRVDLFEDRALLLAARDRRIPPAKDTKVLASWNGLMLAAMSEVARVLRDERYLDAARACAAFVLDRMRQDDGRLLHAFKDGRARFNGYLDDYSCLIDGLTRLYEASGEARWLTEATELSGVMIVEFSDPENGGFFYTGNAHEALIARQKDIHDNATPSGNAMAATALLRLAAITGRDDLEEAGRGTLQGVRSTLVQSPMAAGQSLIALDFLLGDRREYAVVCGDDPEEFREALEVVASRFLPHKVVAPRPSEDSAPAEIPLLADRPARQGRVTTYVCERFACGEPLVGVAALKQATIA